MTLDAARRRRRHGHEIIWRNGDTDPDGNPGDHRIKRTCCGPGLQGLERRSTSSFDWDPERVQDLSINGELWYLDDGFGGAVRPAEPPHLDRLLSAWGNPGRHRRDIYSQLRRRGRARAVTQIDTLTHKKAPGQEPGRLFLSGCLNATGCRARGPDHPHREPAAVVSEIVVVDAEHAAGRPRASRWVHGSTRSRTARCCRRGQSSAPAAIERTG